MAMRTWRSGYSLKEGPWMVSCPPMMASIPGGQLSLPARQAGQMGQPVQVGKREPDRRDPSGQARPQRLELAVDNRQACRTARRRGWPWRISHGFSGFHLTSLPPRERQPSSAATQPIGSAGRGAGQWPSGPYALDQRPASRAKTRPTRAGVLRRGVHAASRTRLALGPWPLAWPTSALCAEGMNGNGQHRRGPWLYAPLGTAFFLALAQPTGWSSAWSRSLASL